MYELLIVSKLSDTDELLARVEKVLKSANAQDLKTDKLGKKNLAYTIKKQTEASYTVLSFNVEGSAISDLTDMLRLEQESLLRYLILTKKTRKLRKKVNKKSEKVEEVKEDKKPKVTVVTKTTEVKTEEKPKPKIVKKTTKAKKK